MRNGMILTLYPAAFVSHAGGRLKQLYDTLKIEVYIPNESLELSQILLVYDPSASAISPDDKQKRLDNVEKELLKLAREAADVKTETVAVEKRWHDAVVGKDRTILNACVNFFFWATNINLGVALLGKMSHSPLKSVVN